MITKLIVTEKCRGLYTDPDGQTRECEHPVSHLPACGPDLLAFPYQPTPVGAEPFTARVLDELSSANALGRYPDIHPATAATLLVFAALYDKHRRPITAEEIAAVLGNAPSTVARHLRGHYFIRHTGGARYAPEPPEGT